MDQRNRDKVNKFLVGKDITPLYLYDTNSERFIKDEIFNPEDSIDIIVLKLLQLLRDCRSINSKTDDLETYADRWRSSLDIWRHILYYRDDITIFDVMNSLYSIRKACGGQFCHNILRRTFKAKHIIFGIKNTYHYVENGWSNQKGFESDEYGLYFKNWETI